MTRLNEMFNYALWKTLPYEIRIIIYLVIATYYRKRNAHIQIGYGQVIQSIKTIQNDLTSECSIICHPFWDIKDPDNDTWLFLGQNLLLDNGLNWRGSISYDNQILIDEKLQSIKTRFHNWKTNDCLSDSYFLASECEFIKNRIKKSLNENFNRRFKILFDSKEIMKEYGDHVYIYYLNTNNEWIKFVHPLPYKKYLPINDIGRYHTFLISHINITDDTLDPISIKQVIEKPLFKFSIDELIKPYFKFSGENSLSTKLFITHRITQP
tara:strand:- start:849 stop:1649 length:801 start_codon:yes stop_codon:yes gene_type:complete